MPAQKTEWEQRHTDRLTYGVLYSAYDARKTIYKLDGLRGEVDEHGCNRLNTKLVAMLKKIAKDLGANPGIVDEIKAEIAGGGGGSGPGSGAAFGSDGAGADVGVGAKTSKRKAGGYPKKVRAGETHDGSREQLQGGRVKRVKKEVEDHDGGQVKAEDDVD